MDIGSDHGEHRERPTRYVEKDGKRYLVIGDKAIEIDEQGQPVEKPIIKRSPDGDVTVQLPYLQLVTEQHGGEPAEQEED